MPDSSPKPEALPFVNLLQDIPADLSVEHSNPICHLGDGAVRIERIVSHGHASPSGYWYDQDEDEWVLLLEGKAQLTIEGRGEPLILTPGDSVLLPAHCRHRIDWTLKDHLTIWLAVFPEA
jgi:cupin 2 domain-containing protein